MKFLVCFAMPHHKFAYIPSMVEGLGLKALTCPKFSWFKGARLGRGNIP